MDIQNNILEKLHCSSCNEYLSCAPIMITENGENLCGRCININCNKKLIRNKAYEDFAAMAAFPCRYRNLGCKVTISWEDVNCHEDHCEYRSTECPVAPKGSCKWKGSQHDLLDHYKKTHPKLILEHPCSLDTDIVVDNDKNMLLSYLGFVFLVQIHCNTALSKLWHCVHCFAQPKIAKQFNFCVQFSSDERSFETKKSVLAEKCLKMQTEKAIESNINGLLQLFDCKNINVVLSILPNIDSDLQNLLLCAECKDPELPAIFKNGDKYYCSNCKQETSFHDRHMEYLYGKVMKRCKNNNAGCPYINMNKKLVYRHEIWECKWQKQCFFDCVLSFDELQNHFNNHANETILNKHLNINSWHYGQIKKDKKIILCKFLMKEAYFKAYFYTQLPIEDIGLYKCIIKFNDGGNSNPISISANEHDWEIYQTFLEKNPHIWNGAMRINDIIISKE